MNLYAYTNNDPLNYNDPTGAAASLVARRVARHDAKRVARRAVKKGAGGSSLVGNKTNAQHILSTGAVTLGGSFSMPIDIYTNDNHSEDDSGGEKVRGEGVRPIGEPVDLPDKLAGEEIVGDFEAGGGENICDEMNDDRYNPKTGTVD